MIDCPEKTDAPRSFTIPSLPRVLNWLESVWSRVNSRLPRFMQDLLAHRLVMFGVRMLVWRISAMLLTSIGTIWTARCLGPTNLGISGFIQTGLGQASILIGILPDSFLIRSYKAATTDRERRDLLELATTIRLALALGVAVIALVAGFVVGVPETWRLSFFSGLPQLLILALNVSWLMQAKEDQPAQYRVQFYTAIVSTTLCVIFFRPGIGPGADLVVGAVSGIAATFVGWRLAKESPFWTYLRRIRPVAAWKVFKESRLVYITGIVIYLYTQFELPLVGYLCSVEELGLYRSAQGLKMTLWTFLSIIPLLLYPRFLEWQRVSPDLLYRNQWKLFRVLAICAVFLSGSAFVLSPSVYPMIFGAAFAPAAIPFAMLVTSLCIILLNNLFSYGLWSQGKDVSMLGISIVAAVASLTLNFLLIPHFGMKGAAAVSILSESLILAMTIRVTIINYRRGRPVES
ncbi:MAG: oligosaccharide flippase family protein [Verrucomicrobiales bacterium]